MKLLWAFCVLLLGICRASASTAGFIKSPLSQIKVLNDSAELHCEVIGNPIPEVQWWFIEGEEPDETFTQLFDGAREGQVHVNATYIEHAASVMLLTNLTFNDTGMYECRASNDPDRNDLRKTPKIKWIRSQANVIVVKMPNIQADPAEVKNMTSAVLTCNLTDSSLPSKGSQWMLKKGDEWKVIQSSESTAPSTVLSLDKITTSSGGIYQCVFLTTPEVRHTIEVKTLPHVGAYKHSEHGTERDKVMVMCVSHGYPLPTDWNWYKVEADGSQTAITNGSGKYELMTTPEKSKLTILDLNMEQDVGDYVCMGTNEVGFNSDKILVRVRNRFAALWPFLGIVAEVIILVTIIFIYEKRRKPDEVTDDDDSGSAPLASNSTVNHKEKNVRQRNSN